MKKGDIIAIYNYDGFSKYTNSLVYLFVHPIHTIRYGFTKIPTHLGLYIGKGEMIEALPNNPIMKSKVKDITHRYEVFRVNRINEKRLTEFCSERLGSGYDFNALASYVLLPLFRILRLKNPLNDKKKFFCSELIAEAINHSLELELFKTAFSTPADIIFKKGISRIK